MSSNQKINYLEKIKEEGVNNIINWYEIYQDQKENFFYRILSELNFLNLHNLGYKLTEFFESYGSPCLIFKTDELQKTINRKFSIDYFLYFLKYDKNNNLSIYLKWMTLIINSKILSEMKYRNMSFFDKFDMMIFSLYVALYFSYEHSKENFPITELNTKKAYHNYVSSNFKSNDDYGYYIHRIIYFFLSKSKDLEFDIKQIVELFSDEENNKNFVLNHISLSPSLSCNEVSSTEEIQNGFKIFKDESNNRIPFVIFKKGTEFFILDLANNESKIIQDKFKKRLILDKLVIGESNIITCDNKVYQFVLI